MSTKVRTYFPVRKKDKYKCSSSEVQFLSLTDSEELHSRQLRTQRDICVVRLASRMVPLVAGISVAQDLPASEWDVSLHTVSP